MTHPGHIDVVYDTIAKAETLEVGVRVLAERGRLVYTGVSTPQRWEWTPIYFKELTIAGSNAFGMEEFDGVRQHALAHYLQLVADGRIDITPDADPSLRAGRVVGCPQGDRPPGPERCPEGGLHAQRLSTASGARAELAEAAVARTPVGAHPAPDRAQSVDRSVPSGRHR